MIERLVIFGAAGDLTSRYLVPALARLHEAALLPGATSILGISQENWGTFLAGADKPGQFHQWTKIQ